MGNIVIGKRMKVLLAFGVVGLVLTGFIFWAGTEGMSFWRWLWLAGPMAIFPLAIFAYAWPWRQYRIWLANKCLLVAVSILATDVAWHVSIVRSGNVSILAGESIVMWVLAMLAFSLHSRRSFHRILNMIMFLALTAFGVLFAGIQLTTLVPAKENMGDSLMITLSGVAMIIASAGAFVLEGENDE